MALSKKLCVIFQTLTLNLLGLGHNKVKIFCTTEFQLLGSCLVKTPELCKFKLENEDKYYRSVCNFFYL